ncbi:MAG: hypothetical protein GF313_10275 [Caldithrix sp.]|nr:hypothetical protein [Caldithrix sp.]
MPQKTITLSHLEWEIMEAIWQLQKQVTVRDVLQHAYPKAEKAYTTVQTVMNNLEGKNILSKEKIGLVNFYVPKVRKQDLMRNEVTRFVNRTFGGSLGNFANYLIKSDILSHEEIEDLKKLIQSKENKKDR